MGRMKELWIDSLNANNQNPCESCGVINEKNEQYCDDCKKIFDEEEPDKHCHKCNDVLTCEFDLKGYSRCARCGEDFCAPVSRTTV